MDDEDDNEDVPRSPFILTGLPPEVFILFFVLEKRITESSVFVSHSLKKEILNINLN